MAEVAAGADTNDVLLHPDALHCLKRRQLENLCIRLDLKTTGKKDELVARLEGYAKGQVALGSSPSRGKMVQARPRTRTLSTRTVHSQTTIGGDDENYAMGEAINETVNDDEEEDPKGLLPSAGPSIRLITTSQVDENEEGDYGQVLPSNGSGRAPLGEVTMNERQPAEAAASLLPSSSSSKSIYPWKRIASTSIPKLARNFSSASTVKGKDDSTSTTTASSTTDEDRKSLNTEFGGGARQDEEGIPRNGSLSSLKRWLSKSKSSLASTSSIDTPPAMESLPLVHPTTSTPPSESVAEKMSSPTSTKRKHGEEECINSILTANDVEEEKPVKRVIKGRPSRAVKQNATVAAPGPLISSPTSITKDDFSKAATKVMEEVNARLQQSGKATMVQVPGQGTWSVSTANSSIGRAGLLPPSSPLKSVNSRTKGRFSGEHAKHFGKMDSIASHYAAKRIEQANKEWRSTSSGSSKSNSSSSSSTSTAAPTSKRIKIAEPSEEQIAKAAESRAVVQRKLDLSRQRRKSAGRARSSIGGRKSVAAASSTPKVGFRSKISGAVRGFVGAARGKTASSSSSNSNTHKATIVTALPTGAPATAQMQRKVTPPQSVIIPPRSASGKDRANTTQQQQIKSASKPAFDLKASLARKPKGYTPYSAKETVQMLQTNPASLSASPLKTLSTATVNTPSPIRSGWTVIPSPIAASTSIKVDTPEASTSSKVAFPCVSPSPMTKKQVDLASEVRAAPRIVRQPSAHITAARKTRSSMSNAKRAPVQVQQQAERLRKAARVNELKHQASMAARKRTGSAIQRAVERGERIAAEINSGTGRGSPRKTSGRITMEGAGRGSAAVKRVS